MCNYYNGEEGEEGVTKERPRHQLLLQKSLSSLRKTGTGDE